MRRFLAHSLLAAAAVFMSGCLFASQNTQKFTINPDGSGKCELRLNIDVASSHWMNALPDGKQMAELVAGSVEGADAWSAISYNVTADNRLEFSGTCYFKSLQDFRLPPMVGGGDLRLVWDDLSGAKAGGGALRMNTSRPRVGGAPMGAPMPPEAADKRVAAIRANWDALKADLARGLARSEGNAKIDITYLLPGKVEAVTGFTEVPGGVRLTGDLKQMLAAVDKLMKDDAAMRDAVTNNHFPGNGSASLPDQIILAMGVLGRPLAVKVAGELKPQFDYAKEVAAAWAAEEAMFAKLEMKGLPKVKLTFADGDNNIVAGLSYDERTLIVRDVLGNHLWSVDVIKAAGPPAIGDPVVRELSIDNNRVNAVYGKNTVASFDLKTGKFLGAKSE